MAHKITRVTYEGAPAEYQFWCPGCGHYHRFEEGRWSFNGDYERPTFSPSLLCSPGTEMQCHLFVRDGRIEFLGDCRHELAGQTVEMDVEERFPADMQGRA